MFDRDEQQTRRFFVRLAGLGLAGVGLSACAKDTDKTTDGHRPGHGGSGQSDDTGSGTGNDDTGSGTGNDDTGTSGNDTGASADDTGAADDTGSGGGETGVETCEETPANIKGPYYIEGAPIRNDLDLYGEKGTKVTVFGRIMDTNCTPIAGAVLEVWHAKPNGDYDNDSKEMEYRGQLATDKHGAYTYHSLVPGHYLNGSQYRPAHIHLKVWVEGKELLTTQMYFQDDPYNDADHWYEEALELKYTVDKSGRWSGTFDIVVS